DQADGDRGAVARRRLRRALPHALQARRLRRAALRRGVVRDGEHQPVGDLPRAPRGGVGAGLLPGRPRRRAGGHSGAVRRLARRVAPARAHVRGRRGLLGVAHLPRGLRHPRLLPVLPRFGRDRLDDLRGERGRLARAHARRRLAARRGGAASRL
ncbi:MAG: hypothetical protein AVDCRST_MAG40-423, partial [uncultured Gemmatimonadaceae bacterium]